MTAHAMKGDRERCLAAGMDGYVTKPIRSEDLSAALARVVSPSEPAGSRAEIETAAVLRAARNGDRELAAELVAAFLDDVPPPSGGAAGGRARGRHRRRAGLGARAAGGPGLLRRDRGDRDRRPARGGRQRAARRADPARGGSGGTHGAPENRVAAPDRVPEGR